MESVYRRIWSTVFWAAGINLSLLVAGDLVVRYRLVPALWSLRGAGLVAAAVLVAWGLLFIWRFANRPSPGSGWC